MEINIYEEPQIKKVKLLEQTSDTFTSYERQDYNTSDKEEGSQKHEEDQCEYESKPNLKSHEDVQFSCDQCDYKATQKGSLKTHIDSVHGDVRYSCDQCDYKATWKGDLTRHIDSVHGDV